MAPYIHRHITRAYTRNNESTQELLTVICSAGRERRLLRGEGARVRGRESRSRRISIYTKLCRGSKRAISFDPARNRLAATSAARTNFRLECVCVCRCTCAARISRAGFLHDPPYIYVYTPSSPPERAKYPERQTSFRRGGTSKLNKRELSEIRARPIFRYWRIFQSVQKGVGR